KRKYDLALGRIDRALEINPSDAESYGQRGIILAWAGRAAEALPWLEGALRFDRANNLISQNLCFAYFFRCRYAQPFHSCDRALSRSPARTVQMQAHPFLAATYAEMGRDQDAEGERAVVMHLSPFFNAQIFAGQFGTQEARDRMLEGLKKAGFH